MITTDTNGPETRGLRSDDSAGQVEDTARRASGPDGSSTGNQAAPSVGMQVEFLPDRVQQHRHRRRRLLHQGYLLAVCVAVMGILTYVRGGRIAEARGNLATIEKSRSNLQRQVAMITPLERQMADLLIKKQIDEELGSRTDCTAVLAELCRITPENVAMASLDLQTVELSAEASAHSGRSAPLSVRALRGARPTVVRKPAVAAATGVRRVRLVVTGLAPTDVDVANFIGQLSSSRLFEDVNMGYTKTVVFRGRSAREFQASCHLAK